jgi:signal transduction histidine kinase
MSAVVGMPQRRPWIGWVSIGAVLSVATLAWLGYRAIAEWQRSAELVARHSADAAVDLLFTAVTRDMRGVQANVLPTLQFDESDPRPALDLNAVASAFARYPYPEAFFAARMNGRLGPITFYSRADRPPAWLPAGRSEPALPDVAFPVVTAVQTPLGDRVLERITRDMRERKTLSAFSQPLGGAASQVIAIVTYSDSAKTRIGGVVGFIVNIDWVRHSYFQDLTAQIERIRSSEPGLRLAVLDAEGTVRGGAVSASERASPTRRRFPLLFFDPERIDLDPPADLTREWWGISASITSGHEVAAVRSGARAALLIASMSALVLAGGLGLAARAVVARSNLVDMRSDFVAAVTHELKAPIATIRASSESLLRRTKVDDSMRRDYCQIVLNEAKRLTRLIDNLLAYARISDTTDVYTFKPTSLVAVVQNGLKGFQFRLDTDRFGLSVDLPQSLPSVRADAAALSLAIDNLLDNAIRYSDDRRQLTVSARAVERDVVLEIADRGVGIPAHEIEQVTQKFFRGSGTIPGGSGLGLAITQRIVSDHLGSMSIQSALGVGTTVALTLPIAERTDDAHPDC